MKHQEMTKEQIKHLKDLDRFKRFDFRYARRLLVLAK